MSCGSGLWLTVTDARRSAMRLFGLTACLGGVALLRPGLASSASKASGPRFRIVSVAGDGNCLFRSVATSEQLSNSKSSPLTRAEEDARSKELRGQAVAELIRERKEIEWAIEGNFESYVRRMARNGEWGGEPELLMLSKAGKQLQSKTVKAVHASNVWMKLCCWAHKNVQSVIRHCLYTPIQSYTSIYTIIHSSGVSPRVSNIQYIPSIDILP